MKYDRLILEKQEYVSLKRILNFHKFYKKNVNKDILESFEFRLHNALIYNEEEMPNDIVRLHSKIILCSNDGINKFFYLVSPSEENNDENKISVLSMLGSNLLGAAVNDTIKIEHLTEIETLKIIKVEKLTQRSSRYYSGVEF